MSKEHVEIVRAGYERFSRTGAIPQDLADPEIEIWESPELPGDLAGQGYDNLDRANKVLLDSFDEWSVEPERFFDLGERILVFVRFRATGKGSGIPVEAPLAHLWTLRDGKIIKQEIFGDRNKALEAAGLRE
jgi:ketosteroid isomerase-like protein